MKENGKDELRWKGYHIISLVRDDIATVGYEWKNLTDEQMEKIAARVRNNLLDELTYWNAIEEAYLEVMKEEEEINGYHYDEWEETAYEQNKKFDDEDYDEWD